MNIELSHAEALNAARAMRLSASEAYDDDRLNCAIAEYRVAAKLYDAVGNKARANSCTQLAWAIEAEIRAIAAGDEEEARYLEEQNASWARS